MVSPDQRIDPNKNIARTNAEEAKRKPPVRDFNEVVEQLDQKRHKDEEESEEGFSKDKKKSLLGKEKTTSSSHSEPLLSPFDLASRGGGGQDDSESSESLPLASIEEKKREITEPKSWVTQEEKLPSQPRSKQEIKPAGKGLFGLIEQPDLAAFPMAPAVLDASIQGLTRSDAPKMAMPMQGMQEIIDQIVDQVYTLRKEELNQTIVTLKGNFAGSHLIISESASAPGQLNVTIDNLTSASQTLLETNKQHLIDRLAERNVVVQIFTASTTQESPIAGQADKSELARDAKDFTGQQKKQKKQQEA